MTLTEYLRLSREYRLRIVPTVKTMYSFGTVKFTKSAETAFRQAMGLTESEEIPKEVFDYELKSVEIQDSLDEDQLLCLVWLTLPKMVDGTLSYSREHAADYKCIVRIYPKYLLIISASETPVYKKASISSMFIDRKSQVQKCQRLVDDRSVEVSKLCDESLSTVTITENANNASIQKKVVETINTEVSK